MNDRDLLCVVIEQLLDADTIADFARTVRDDPQTAAADLSRCTPPPVMTAEYVVSADAFGVIASNSSGRTSAMNWDRVADALAGAGLAERSDEIAQLRTAPDQVAQQIRGDLARRATLAGKLAERPLQRLDVAGHDVAVDFDRDTATLRIDGSCVVSLTPWENVAAANVAIHDANGSETHRMRVQFVPPGYARPGRAANVGDRVSLERLDEPGINSNHNHPSLAAGGGKFALQVDGYDVAICEVGASRMRTTIYDQNPRNAFLAHESVSTLAVTDVGAQQPTAAERLVKMCERRSGPNQQGLER